MNRIYNNNNNNAAPRNAVHVGDIEEEADRVLNRERLLETIVSWTVYGIVASLFFMGLYVLVEKEWIPIDSKGVVRNIRDLIHFNDGFTAEREDPQYFQRIINSTDHNATVDDLTQEGLVQILHFKYLATKELNFTEHSVIGAREELRMATANELHVDTMEREKKVILLCSITADFKRFGIDVSKIEVLRNVDHSFNREKTNLILSLIGTLHEIQEQIDTVIIPLICEYEKKIAEQNDIINVLKLNAPSLIARIPLGYSYTITSILMGLEKMYHIALFSISMYNPYADDQGTDRTLYFVGSMMTGYGIHFFPLIAFIAIICFFQYSTWPLSLIFGSSFDDENREGFARQLSSLMVEWRLGSHNETYKYFFAAYYALKALRRSLLIIVFIFVASNSFCIVACCCLQYMDHNVINTRTGDYEGSFTRRYLSDEIMKKISNRAELVPSLLESMSLSYDSYFRLGMLLLSIVIEMIIRLATKFGFRYIVPSMYLLGNRIIHVTEGGYRKQVFLAARIIVRWFFQGFCVHTIFSSIIMSVLSSRTLFPLIAEYLSIDSMSLSKLAPWSSIFLQQAP